MTSSSIALRHLPTGLALTIATLSACPCTPALRAPDGGGDGAVHVDSGAQEGGILDVGGDGAMHADAEAQESSALDAFQDPDASPRHDGATTDATLPPLATPANVVVTVGAALRVQCDAVQGAARYEVLVASTSAGHFTLAASARDCDLVVRGRVPARRFFLMVRAADATRLSDPSGAVSAVPLDGVPFWRGAITGTVRHLGTPVSGAVVHLHTAIDHGVLLGETTTQGDGRYTMVAPVGSYQGVSAGLDLNHDGTNDGAGVDAVGVFRPASAPFALHHDATAAGCDVDLAVTATPRTVTGALFVNVGWGQSGLAVDAMPVGSSLRPYQKRLASPGPFLLRLAAGAYEVQGWLDLDADGLQGVNEPRSRYLAVVDVTLAGDTGKDIVIAERSSVAGHLIGLVGYSVQAHDLQLDVIYSAPARSDGSYSVGVPLGRSFDLMPFVDLDLNGRRSWFDHNGNGRRDADEPWSEPGLAPRRNVDAATTGHDFDLGTTHLVTGQVLGASEPWRILATAPDGDTVFAITTDATGHFSLPVAAHDGYTLTAYIDDDGDERPSTGRDRIKRAAELVNASGADVSAVEL